jgi:hypothetical protein
MGVDQVSKHDHSSDADGGGTISPTTVDVDDHTINNSLSLPTGYVAAFSSESVMSSQSAESVTTSTYASIGDSAGPTLPLGDLENGNVAAAVRFVARMKTHDSTTTAFVRPEATLDPVPELELSKTGDTGYSLLDSGWVRATNLSNVPPNSIVYWRIEAKNSDGSIGTSVADASLMFGGVVL